MLPLDCCGICLHFRDIPCSILYFFFCDLSFSDQLPVGCSNEAKMHAAMRKKPVTTSNSSQVSIPVPAHQPSKTGNTMKKWGKNKGRTILSACCLQGELLWMWTRGVVTLQQCGSCYWVIAVYKLFLLKLPMCIPNVDVKIVKCWEHSCEEQWIFANTPFFIN